MSATLNSASARRKSVFQVGFALLSIFFYIWYLEHHSLDWLRAVFFWGVCVGFPIACVAYDQKAFPEFSLDWDNFLRSFSILLWFTLIATVALTAMALILKNFNYDGKFMTRVFEYVFWAFLQEIGLQTFLTRRVHRALSKPFLAALVSTTLFSLIHFPNPVLMIFCFVGGFFWSYSYIKAPNLYLIALSHGWLAVVALHAVPPAWLHGLRIGPGYFTFIP